MKAIVWIGSSKKDLQHVFTGSARKEAGYQIDRIQRGVDPKDWKPLSGVGPGIREIRIYAESDYRILYVAGFGGGVLRPPCVRKKDAEDSGT